MFLNSRGCFFFLLYCLFRLWIEEMAKKVRKQTPNIIAKPHDFAV